MLYFTLYLILIHLDILTRSPILEYTFIW